MAKQNERNFGRGVDPTGSPGRAGTTGTGRHDGPGGPGRATYPMATTGRPDAGARRDEDAGQGVAGAIGAAREAATGYIGNHPVGSVLASFGIGFGLGLVITAVLTPPREKTWGEAGWDAVDRAKQSLSSMPQAAAEYLSGLWNRR